MTLGDAYNMYNGNEDILKTLKPTAEIMDPEQVYTDFAEVVGTRKNTENIIAKFSGKSKEFVSKYMDFCVDEEAIDALVGLGGDPSCFNGRSHLNYIDRSRTFVRRLYHGATKIPTIIVMDAYMALTSIFTSRMTVAMVKMSTRNAKYGRVENEKFDYWLENFPGTFKEHVDIHQNQTLGEFSSKTRIRLPRGGKDKYLYYSCDLVVDGESSLKTELSYWVKYELAFGAYHRAKISAKKIKQEAAKARAEKRNAKRKRDE